MSASAQGKAPPGGKSLSTPTTPHTNRHISSQPAQNGQSDGQPQQSLRVLTPVSNNSQPSAVHPHYGDKFKDRIQQENKNAVHG